MSSPVTVLLDIDGTLVDTNYFHTLAWYRALRRSGRTVEMSTIHRLIGMGSDQFLSRLIDGEDARIEEWWQEHFAALRPEVHVTPGAAELVRTLKERGATTVYASSGQPDDVRFFRDLIGADQWIDEVVNSSEVEASKPAPDIFELALARAGAAPNAAMVIGDTVWDVEAAAACGLRCVAVTTGGISRAELAAAGAAAVYDSPAALLAELATSPLGPLLASSPARRE